jgi:hypothetical protein
VLEHDQRKPSGKDIGDFARSTTLRREAAWALPMNERLARLHSLCKQIGAIRSASRSS